MKGYAKKFLRRFLDPLPNREGNLRDADFDVILENWYPDVETQVACGKHLSTPAIAKEIAEDEAKLFDRTRMCGYLLTEHNSDLA